MNRWWIAALASATLAAGSGEWTSLAPRDEIKPQFSRDASGALVIEQDAREGLHGYWRKEFPVIGGKHYEFNARRKVLHVNSPRRSAFVTIEWHDENNRKVMDDRPLVERYLKTFPAWTFAEYPEEGAADERGWTQFRASYQAPAAARKAVVDLHFLWAPGGRAEWRDVSLRETAAPAGRRVRMAAVNFRPQGCKAPECNCRLFAPLIEKAAAQKADLVVLPETLTYYGTGLTPLQTAEPVPGPSTEYFGGLARKHGLYIVVGLFERAGHLVYNVAVLLDPDGKVAGKYRKVVLPDGEWNQGIAPGTEYPVFQTRFGKLGMMVCYDGFFPEVARELTRRGAEVIAWPVWGCNPALARARAAENHVYLVSSTYEDISRDWMLTAIWDHTGDTIALAKQWGEVAIAEVDLDARTRWRGLGDFKAKLLHHAPLAVPENRAK
jgi:predicted amidohydrolase